MRHKAMRRRGKALLAKGADIAQAKPNIAVNNVTAAQI